MKTFFLLIALLFSSSFLLGCNSTTSHETAMNTLATANALVELRRQYHDAANALISDIDRLPTEDGLQLLAYKAQADDLVKNIERYWRLNKLATLSDAENLYLQATDIYRSGSALVKENWSTLTKPTQQQLNALAASATAINDARERIENNPDSMQQAEMVRAGLEFATMALKLGMAVM